MSDLDARVAALKACPFCGNTPRLVDLAGFEVICDCGVVLCLDEPDRESVVAAWNRRAELQKPVLHSPVTDAEVRAALHITASETGVFTRYEIAGMREALESFLQGRAKPAQEEITDVEIEFIQDECMERTEHGVKLDAIKFARKVIRASKGEKT